MRELFCKGMPNWLGKRYMSEKAAVSGYLYALSAAALWSLLGPLSRFCFAHGMEPLEVAFWRAGLGGLCFGVHAARCGEVRGKKGERKRRKGEMGKGGKGGERKGDRRGRREE